MNKEIFEKFIEDKVSTPLMAEALEISVSTVQYYLKKYDLVSNAKRGARTQYYEKCIFCSKDTERGKMYCSSSCKSKQHVLKTYKSKPRSYAHLTRAFKLAALEYCGKSCKHCGYDKKPSALAFHHVDPLQKDYQVSCFRRTKLNEKDKKELDKCITLCHNCHALVHDSIEKLKASPTKQAIKGARVRRELIDLKGGKCQSCDLKSEVNRVYAFHHVDPSTKEFTIDSRTCNGYKKERLLAEAEKCILLCHNCHSEKHV